jgi:hypothetical protein
MEELPSKTPKLFAFPRYYPKFVMCKEYNFIPGSLHKKINNLEEI